MSDMFVYDLAGKLLPMEKFTTGLDVKRRRAEDVTRPTHVTKREARAPFMGDASARNQNYRLSSGNLTPIFSENLSAGVRMHKMRAGQRQHLQQTNIQLQQIIRNTRTSR